ncbi:MAG: glycosyltransferase family 9 protein, partial [Selenomonadaceae bacterium]|nr:glycosyltransferase family 9 protein [Selenomonadaceae bacterium]
DVSNVLILHEAATGDFVVMSAGIREIRRIWPSAHITLVVDVRAESLAEYCPHVDEIIVQLFRANGNTTQGLPNTLTNIIAKINVFSEVAEKLLVRRYDIAFATLYSAYPSTPLLAYMAGARRRISHVKNIFWAPLLTDRVPTKNYGSHAADRVLSYVEYVTKVRPTNRRLEAWFPSDDVDAVKKIVPPSKKLYAIGLGSGHAQNHYPPKSYAELIRLIMSEDDEVNFILIGGLNEVDESVALMENVDPNRVINLVDKISFRQTAAALSLCDLYIGNDTGSTHLAAANSKPVLAVYPYPFDLNRAVKSYHRWHPYCVPAVIVCPAHALPRCRGSKNFFGCRVHKPHCITQITPQNLFDAYKILLERAAEGNTKYAIFNPEKGALV